MSGQLGGINVINSDPQGTLRIYDNDKGVFSVADVTVVEGDVVAGEGVGVLVTVTRFGAGPQQGNQEVTVSTLPISGSDTAQAEDFTATTNVVLTFAPGETTQTVFIPINDDLLVETQETFRVELSNPTGDASIAQLGLSADDGVAVVTIIDNDGDAVFATITVDDSEIQEGGDTATYTVALVDKAGAPVTVPPGATVTVALNWSGVANADDIAGVLPFTVDIVGNQPATFTVDASDDYVLECPEALIATLTAVTDSSGSFDSSVVATIANGYGSDANIAETTILDDTDEPDPKDPVDTVYTIITVNDSDIEEGEQATFTVSLVDKDGVAVVAPTNIDVTLQWSDPAANSDDATPLPTTVTITAGNTSTGAVVTAVDDVYKESAEALTARITAVADQSSPASFENLIVGGQASATTTITDEIIPEPDDTVTFSIVGPASVTEGDQTDNYTVKLTNPANAAITAEEDVVVTITYTGTATDGADYIIQQSVTISKGSAEANFKLLTETDVEADNNETIILTIATQDDGGFEKLALGTSSVTTTIIENEPNTVFATITVDDSEIQ